MSAGAHMTARAKPSDERRHACMLIRRLTLVTSGNIAIRLGNIGIEMNAAPGTAQRISL